jgi:hypothetical protein
MEKVEGEIQSADLIIGDITFSSPNVFYELGIARAFGKPIIFMTQEGPERAPVDLRQFEFISYDLSKDQDLLSKLDNAVRNALGEAYGDLFEEAVEILRQLNADTGSSYRSASFEEFQARVVRGENLEGIPDSEYLAFREFMLPKIVADATDINVIRKLNRWLSDQS